MRSINFILVLVMAVFISSCGDSNKETIRTKTKQKPLKVEVTKVTKSESKYNYTYSGLIEPSVQTSLSFQSMGVVEKVYVDEGDFVKKGQLLAKLDPTSQQNAYNAALATQKQAQDAYDRLKTVYEKGSLPEIKWEDIKTSLDQANASAAISKKNLENKELRAPYSGVIGSRDIELGSSVNPAITVFDIVTINDVFARISVPENEISKFRKGQIASVNIPAVGAQNYQAKVEKIGVIANQLSKTYAVKLIIKNSDLKIKPGMVCDTEISIDEPAQVLTLPMQAVVNEPNENPSVFVVNKKDKKVSEREITVGSFSNSQVQVVSGLNEGELVVIKGQQKLVQDMPVVF